MGVYLHCIEYEGAWLVNYPGKASGQTGLCGRLCTEWKDWTHGEYFTALSVPDFPLGLRIVMDRYPNDIRDQIEHLAPIMRILIAELRNDEECQQVENTVVNTLRQDLATFQFLANKDKKTKYHPARQPVVRFANSPKIIGLTAPVPLSLSRKVAAAIASGARLFL
jgi:hypothetical protein